MEMKHGAKNEATMLFTSLSLSLSLPIDCLFGFMCLCCVVIVLSRYLRLSICANAISQLLSRSTFLVHSILLYMVLCFAIALAASNEC